MRLFYSPTSPYVRKCMVLLHEAGMRDRVSLIAATGTPVDAGTMPVAQNPLGKIPTLERDDGPALYDSRVICRYLDHLSGKGLYPAAPRLWDTLTLEATGDGITEAAVLMMYEVRVRPEDKRFEAWIEGHWDKIARALDALENRWISHLSGPLDMGQISVACAIGYLDFRHHARGWRKGRPGLDAWYDEFAKRPSMLATRPPG